MKGWVRIFENVVRRLQSSLLDLRHLRIRPSRHPSIYKNKFLWNWNKSCLRSIPTIFFYHNSDPWIISFRSSHKSPQSVNPLESRSGDRQTDKRTNKVRTIASFPMGKCAKNFFYCYILYWRRLKHKFYTMFQTYSKHSIRPGPQISFFLIIWAAIYQNPKENWTKYQFFFKFWIQFGPQKNIFDPHAARGPQVWRPCIRRTLQNWFL
jgi:hypothetical protein